ncbi:MAG TPA: PEP-CTERM sorting domain-containing protein [Phycisphaerae bacterium]|nr:PEP-CTERM sorting domain-containing protein [Phycisphaerae bacterium]
MNRINWTGTLVVAIALAGPAYGINGTPTWFESEVGVPLASSYVSTPVLAFDHYGSAAVSWSSVSQVGGAHSVRYSQLQGFGQWNTRELASAVGSGLRTSLSFDRSERPSVAWVNQNGSVQASFNLGAAQELTATGANSTNPIVSLSHDLAGSLRGMYSRTTPTGNLFDIGYSGTLFSNASMTTLSGVTSILDAAMLADDRGLRQLAARVTLSAGNQGLVLASEPFGGGSWSAVTHVAADNVTGVDLAMDPTDGRMAVAYSTRDNAGVSKLYYSKFNGFSMQTTELASSTNTFRYEDVSLAFDFSDGLPAIAYERKNTGSGAEELMFAYRDSVMWQLPVSPVDGTISMDAPGNKIRRPSLAFDDFGTSWPAIAYADSDGSLNVAFDPPVPEPGVLGLVIVGLAVVIQRRRRVYPCLSGRRAGV